jgi:sulfite reductase (NADPH) hemoprotein beta-component
VAFGIYRYDAIDKAIVQDRAAEFREQVQRRLAGEISEDEFKPLRLMNGLYLQLHGYMLRVAIPYGTLSGDQLRTLAEIGRRFDKGYGHFTTRTNIQFNWIRLRDAPDILDMLADADLHAIQTSGNCIRNTTADPFAGAAADEVDDPRVWSEAIRQWSTLHPEFSFLPRKFKIAVTATGNDRTASRFHDIGLKLHRRESGDLAFEVIVGGGLGRTPYVGQTIRRDLPPRHLMSYLTAILRTYNRLGRRDNLYKARIKILVASFGADEFARLVEAEWSEIDKEQVDLPAGEVTRIRESFGMRAFEALPAVSERLECAKANALCLAAFVRTNVLPHREPGYGVVNISLKAPGEAPGDCSSEQMDQLADLADSFSFSEIRVTHEQNLVLPHVRLDDVPDVHAKLEAIGLATANINLASDIIACPGLDYCALANARAIPLAQEISRRLADPGLAADIGELKINISGCINACGHHHVGHIGILGVDKKGEEFYQLTLGGSPGLDDAAIGDVLGPALPFDQTPAAVEAIVLAYRRERLAHERFLQTYRRVGLTPFKAAVYAHAH